MAKCIYCDGTKFEETKLYNHKMMYRCARCSALYLSLEDVRREIINQINLKVYEYDGKSYC